ncbi:hypothetical protein M427DRAFT_313689 [Gonapodya prolifera JEL478]|uniref:Uncharacterized protein n=1 Tax=Gonapodya prolifera (strain JEL478) TaxID=1344416 RepID=A0A139AWT9_GONPJ|nr:hypothetical protein M427DRAFT_313689 [Gonapodya prolifera JEL478]|eukprot:KXS21206.1 hypothetical protein M427DRAFT_313689 [Gonapodya prolifera JEL478]
MGDSSYGWLKTLLATMGEWLFRRRSASLTMVQKVPAVTVDETSTVVAALRNTVHRLSSELARYQAKYPPLSPSPDAALPIESVLMGSSLSSTPKCNTGSSWVYAAKQLDPLFKAYDDRIAEIEKKLEDEKSAHMQTTAELSTARSQVSSISSQLALVSARVRTAEERAEKAEEEARAKEEEIKEARDLVEERERDAEEWEKAAEAGEGEVSNLRPALLASSRNLSSLTRAHSLLQARLRAAQTELEVAAKRYEGALKETEKWRNEARREKEGGRRLADELEATRRELAQVVAACSAACEERERIEEERRIVERRVAEGEAERAGWWLSLVATWESYNPVAPPNGVLRRSVCAT